MNLVAIPFFNACSCRWPCSRRSRCRSTPSRRGRRRSSLRRPRSPAARCARCMPSRSCPVRRSRCRCRRGPRSPWRRSASRSPSAVPACRAGAGVARAAAGRVCRARVRRRTARARASCSTSATGSPCSSRRALTAAVRCGTDGALGFRQRRGDRPARARGRGRRGLDRLVVSHADNDHAGGAAAIVAAFPGCRRAERSRRRALARPHVRRRRRWEWDGVRFSILHPARISARAATTSSCVLKVETGASSLLVTGDIERRGESAVLAQGPLAADVVVVPHHGSATSSSPAFVAAVGAQHAIVSAGYANRWGFPRPEVRERWRAERGGRRRHGRRGRRQRRASARAASPSRRNVMAVTVIGTRPDFHGESGFSAL